ncbi:MAG: hypothetical protein ABDH49_03635 [Candidatus Hydrothermales bacterium]
MVIAMQFLFIIFSFFEFKPKIEKSAILFVPYEINYYHFGAYGVATDNKTSLYFINPHLDIGLSLLFLLDEGISSRRFYAEDFAYSYGLNLFIQKRFIKSGHHILFPLEIKTTFTDFRSQLRTIESLQLIFKIKPTYYYSFSRTLRFGTKVEGIYNSSGERRIFVVNPNFEFAFFPERIASVFFSVKYKSLFSDKVFSYPQLGLTLFSNPLPNIFGLLEGFISIRSKPNPFRGGNRGDYLYGEPVLKEGAGMKFILGLIFFIEKKRKIQIFVKDEEGIPLSPTIEENPPLQLTKKAIGFYEKMNAKPDTYFLKFVLEGYKDTFLHIYPEDTEKDLVKYTVTMKKIFTLEEETLKIPEHISRTDFYFYFDSAKAEIKEFYRDTFDLVFKIFNSIQDDTIKLLLKGNASPEGDTLFNRRLSYERADRVSNFIKVFFKGDKSLKFEIVSEYDPKIKPEDLSKNQWRFKRRAYLKILK